MKQIPRYNDVFKTMLILFLGISFASYSQKDEPKKKLRLQNKSRSIQAGYENGENDFVIASKYEDLAKELVIQKDYTKAEEYQKKAIELYTKLEAKRQLAEALRVLAKMQEAQNKTKEAISNYDKATENSDDVLNKTLNNSDVNRLVNSSNVDIQCNSINEKLNTLKAQPSIFKKEEISESYKQLAEINLKQNNSQGAIKNYNNALDLVTNETPESNTIKSEIADIYAKDKNFKQAIIIKNDVLQSTDKSNDVSEQIKQRQSLAKLLILNDEHDKGLLLIQEAYNLALLKGKTLDAKNSLIQLIDFYKSKHENEKISQLYEGFLQKLESLIKADSTLIDKKLFEESDNKIKQLEQEKKLKDELITKKNNFNYFLIGSLIILLILIIIIIKYSLTVGTKNKKISLQSLRREMNPHFIFNSLNSVNQFIAQNKEIEANKYLTSYSSLMRNMMENSSKDFIPLQKEIEQLKKYLELEHLRFNDQFDYEVLIDETIDTETLLMPNMLVQPHIENAIWHGLRYKEQKGLLKILLKNNSSYFELIIDDDGIGIEKSKELKTQNQKVHQSIGIKNITERIDLLNDLYNIKIVCDIINKELNTGTTVILKIPHLNKV